MATAINLQEVRMSEHRKLFAATQWVLKAAVVVVIVLAASDVLQLVLPGAGTRAMEMTARYFADLAEISLSPGDAPKFHFIFTMGSLATQVLALFILRAIRRIVISANVGDPFITKNAEELARIAWLLLGIQAVDMLTSLLVYGVISADARTKLLGPAGAGIFTDVPISGLIAVLLTFILAHIFKRGAQMRAEMEGTV